jgi:Flp pilus assembly protein protease CpaA
MALMLFLSPILFVGALTTFTDLKSKKIYNQHLIMGAVLGLLVTGYAAAFRHEQVLFHFINGIAAFLIGLLLHRFSLWRGGDAKLFTLYAFLMPAPAYNYVPFPSAVSLFACSFIAGMVILIPVFIKDIIINHKVIANSLALPATRQALFKAIARIAGSSWVLFPFYYLAKITNPVIILAVSYLFFSWGYEIKKEAQKHYIIEFLKNDFIELFVVIVFGFSMRLWLYPNSLSYPALTRYIMMITLTVTLSSCLHTALGHLKEYRDRVPFAPLLFIGCALSYTPFLTQLTHMVARWNVLFSR